MPEISNKDVSFIRDNLIKLQGAIREVLWSEDTPGFQALGDHPQDETITVNRNALERLRKSFEL